MEIGQIAQQVPSPPLPRPKRNPVGQGAIAPQLKMELELPRPARGSLRFARSIAGPFVERGSSNKNILLLIFLS